MSDPSHVLKVQLIEFKNDITYEVQLEIIVDQQLRKLRSEDIALIKMKWKGHSREEAT